MKNNVSETNKPFNGEEQKTEQKRKELVKFMASQYILSSLNHKKEAGKMEQASNIFATI